MPSGDLITDSSKADAILDPQEAAQATDVVVGTLISDAPVEGS